MLAFRRAPAVFNRISFSLASRRWVSDDLRTRLRDDIKTAMKARDSLTSTTLRSVLAEVNAVDKTAPEPIPSSAIADIIRKAVQRRAEAASKFIEADRPELAEKEQKEAELLSALLPPLLSEAAIDGHISSILETVPLTDGKKSLGLVLKEFYSRVNKSEVDSNLVKQRVELLVKQKLS
ncbi:Yqey-like protein-domain-containing protein [Panaeolus papilionaceus]|nr:Yqey-like protein-domain-containing protein [Panaeolus papilionaceus]